MSTGDIKVIGLVMGTHVLEDIGMDVPHGATVTIPADRATRSKDLWRAISQKLLFQIQTGPGSGYVPTPPRALPVPGDVLQARVHELEARNKRLEEENKTLRDALQASLAQSSKFDAIMVAIQQQGLAPRVGAIGPVVGVDVADGTAPQFIPAEIAPKGAETRIDVVKKESGDSDVSAAAGQLRKLRKSGR